MRLSQTTIMHLFKLLLKRIEQWGTRRMFVQVLTSVLQNFGLFMNDRVVYAGTLIYKRVRCVCYMILLFRDLAVTIVS